MAKSKPSKRKFRLIPRVQDIGFFQGVLVSRTRLVTAAVLVTIAEMGIIYVVSNWMRSSSGSPMLNVLIITLMLTGLIIAAYLDALLIGDLFFPGKWRERVLLGKDFQPKDWEEEREYIKEYNAPFFVVLIVTLLVLSWVSQVISDHFLSYYQNLGFALAMMRSEDPEERQMGLEEMANPIHEEYWGDDRLHELLAEVVHDPEPEIQEWACYLAGRVNAVVAADPILEVFQGSEDATVRAEAAMALGRLRWEPSLAYMASRLRKPERDDEETIGILQGYAMMEDPRAGGAVASVLEQALEPDQELSLEVVRNAFYAVRKMEYKGARPVAKRYLSEKGTSLEEKCAAADAMRFISTAKDIEFLQSQFELIGSEDLCDYAMWRYHDEKAIEIVEKEPLRSKLVRAVGNQKKCDSFDWIYEIGLKAGKFEEHQTTGKVAEMYIRAMCEICENKCVQ